MASAALYDNHQTATDTPEPLNDGVSQPCDSGVLVQADPGNAVALIVGNKNSQSISLAAGAAEYVNIDDVAKLYIKRASAGACVANWHALGGS